MPAYLISDMTIKDSAAFHAYRSQAAASIERHGGHYLVRGGEVEALEGSWSPNTIIIVEFPNIEIARAWYRSPEYAAALAFRDEALSRNLILMDGIAS